jgi:hypothetical protein
MRSVLALAALLTAGMLDAAHANCIPNKTLTSWTGGAYGYFYVNLPTGYDNGTTIGRFWQAGARGLANEGTFDDSQWLRLYPATSKWYILGELGTVGVLGCPTGSLIVTLDTLGGHNLTAQVDETAGVFDLTRFQTDFDLGSKPRPIVASASRTGGTLTAHLRIEAQGGGIYTLGTAVAATPTYRIVSALSASDPGGLASAYIPGPAIAPGTLVPFQFDCADPFLTPWVAVQTIVDAVGSDTVSTRTALSCQILAEPSYKRVDRPAGPNRRERR